MAGSPPSLWDLSTGKVSQTFQGHTEPVLQVAFSPDGAEVVTASALAGDIPKPSADNSIRLWDIASGKQVQRFDIPGYQGAISMQFSADGKRLLTVDRLNIRVWDIATGRQLFDLSSGVNPTGHAASFSPDLRTILVMEQGMLRLVEYASGKERCKMGTSRSYWDAEFSPDGSQIVAVASELPLSQTIQKSWIRAVVSTSTNFLRTPPRSRELPSARTERILLRMWAARRRLSCGTRNQHASYEPLCRLAPSMSTMFRSVRMGNGC